MKTVNFLMVILLGMIMLAACSTDDLKRDIDDLKDRVSLMEAQVSLLNDNVNTLRVFIDGNKTVTNLETTGTPPNQTYKLHLSDGQVMSLTQGSVGTVSTPDITINDQGYWVINGKATDKKAEGDNAPTPKFQIEASTSYWQVSYDDGSNWTYVTDTAGNNVKATEGGSSTQDTFFKAVHVNGNNIDVTLQDGKTYSLPIVADLLCEIMNPDSNYKDGIWTIGYGKTVTTKIVAKGDDVLVTAPSGWKASVEITNETTGEGLLTVTAPATGAQSRATADNMKDLVIQVNKGIYWAVDKMQVVAEESVNSYKALYDAGKDIVVGDVTINKATYGDSHVLNGDNQTIDPAGGVYFVEAGTEVEYKADAGFKQLILIGDDPSQKSTLKVKEQMKVIENTDGEDLFVCSNLTIDAGELGNYLLVQNGNTAFDKVVFNDCRVTLTPDKTLAYIGSSTRSINNLTIEGCIFDFISAKSAVLVAVSSSTAKYGTLTFRNNVFYCKDKGKTSTDFKLFNGPKASVQEIVVENNTFVNMACNTNFYVNADNLSSVIAQKNLFYLDVELANAVGLFRIVTAGPQGTVCKDNVGYKTGTKNWQAFFGGIKNGFDGAEEIINIPDNPFDGGMFDLAAGLFVPNATYTSYGAQVH